MDLLKRKLLIKKTILFLFIGLMLANQEKTRKKRRRKSRKGRMSNQISIGKKYFLKNTVKLNFSFLFKKILNFQLKAKFPLKKQKRLKFNQKRLP